MISLIDGNRYPPITMLKCRTGFINALFQQREAVINSGHQTVNLLLNRQIGIHIFRIRIKTGGDIFMYAIIKITDLAGAFIRAVAGKKRIAAMTFVMTVFGVLQQITRMIAGGLF